MTLKLSSNIHAQLHSKTTSQPNQLTTYCSWYLLSLSISVWHWEIIATFQKNRHNKWTSVTFA